MKLKSAALISCCALAAIGVGAYVKRTYDAAYAPTTHIMVPRPYRVGQGVKALAFSPDDKSLAVSDMQSSMRVLRLPDLREAPSVAAKSQDDATTLAWTSDGKQIVEGDGKGMSAWSVSSRKSAVLLHPNLPVASLQGVVQEPKYILSSSGAIAAGGLDDATLRLWNVATGKSRRLPLPESYASSSIDNAWNFPTPASKDLSKRDPLVALAFSPDSRTLATIFIQYRDAYPTLRPVICLYDTNSGNLIRSWYWEGGMDLLGIMNSMALAFSQDGTALASEDDAQVTLWKIPTGAELLTLKRDNATGGNKCLAFVPGSPLLASASCIDDIEIWNVTTGQLVRSLHGAKFIYSLAVSHDGQFVAAGGQDAAGNGILDLWNISRLK